MLHAESLIKKWFWFNSYILKLSKVICEWKNWMFPCERTRSFLSVLTFYLLSHWLYNYLLICCVTGILFKVIIKWKNLIFSVHVHIRTNTNKTLRYTHMQVQANKSIWAPTHTSNLWYLHYSVIGLFQRTKICNSE